MSTKWRLEIHDETKGRGSIPSLFDFDDFPSPRSSKTAAERSLCGRPIRLIRSNSPALLIFEVRALGSNGISKCQRTASKLKF
jgi:hypothetical protein